MKQRCKANRDNYEFSTQLKFLMWAISKRKTMVNFSFVHFCLKHNEVVDRNHIDKCDNLKDNLEVDPTFYREMVTADNLMRQPPDVLKKIHQHYVQLELNIRNLEESEVYIRMQIDRTPTVKAD